MVGILEVVGIGWAVGRASGGTVHQIEVLDHRAQREKRPTMAPLRKRFRTGETLTAWSPACPVRSAHT